MKKCLKECILEDKDCVEKECRSWINYEEDFNCSLCSIHKHGRMTLEQVANRLELSIVRIKQIQDKAIEKLQKKRHLKAF
jgi:hypothetical protein